MEMMLAALILLAIPKLTAVQLWKAEPVQAWTPDGSRIVPVVKLDHGDYSFYPLPTGRRIELIVEVDQQTADDFPDARWKALRGMRCRTMNSGWKSGSSDSHVACFSLLGTSTEDTADLRFQLASGPYKTLFDDVNLSNGKWTALSGGIRARLAHRKSGSRASTTIELTLPKSLHDKDIEPVLTRTASKQYLVETISKDGKWKATFEGAPSKQTRVTLKYRDYKTYAFNHIHLKPKASP